MKPEIVEVLEKGRDEELTERREKRKKASEEEAAKKAAEDAKKTATSSEIKMEVIWYFFVSPFAFKSMANVQM